MRRYTGDPARDLLADEMLGVERRIRVKRGDVLRHLQFGIGLTDGAQRKRLREYRELLAHRALIRDLERGLDEREAEEFGESATGANRS